MTKSQQPRTFPILRYFFGIWYLWYIALISNGDSIIITAIVFGIVFGAIDWLANENEDTGGSTTGKG
tara:strand:+ start:144 stop:344 length:201 start_codon:yes stop_codon:yes gene_type:complete